MTTEQLPRTAPNHQGPGAAQLADRLLGDSVTAMETLSVSLGVRLGLYQALADGPADARRLAERAGVHPRYAREWLEQQAVAGLLHAAPDPPATDADPYARIFTLPEGHREVLVDTDSPYFLGTLPGFVASFGMVFESLAAAYRTGGGVAYEAYGALTRHGIAGMNRPMYRTQLSDWIAALPDIEQHLAGSAKVLDVGCGTGASSLAIATLFPEVRVHGVDLDAASVAEAQAAAGRERLADRVTFAQGDAADLTGDDRYQLICLFEVLHDMADPVAALRAVRSLLAPGGAVLVGDERVAERFTAADEVAPGDLVERLNYGFSVLHCLPATRAEGSAVEAGTVLRPDTIREYAERAGYTYQVLPVDHDLWRFYRLDPA